MLFLCCFFFLIKFHNASVGFFCLTAIFILMVGMLTLTCPGPFNPLRRITLLLLKSNMNFIVKWAPHSNCVKFVLKMTKIFALSHVGTYFAHHV